MDMVLMRSHEEAFDLGVACLNESRVSDETLIWRKIISQIVECRSMTIVAYHIANGSIRRPQPNDLKRGWGPNIEEITDVVREHGEIGREIFISPDIAWDCDCDIKADISPVIMMRMIRLSLSGHVNTSYSAVVHDEPR